MIERKNGFLKVGTREKMVDAGLRRRLVRTKSKSGVRRRYGL